MKFQSLLKTKQIFILCSTFLLSSLKHFSSNHWLCCYDDFFSYLCSPSAITLDTEPRAFFRRLPPHRSIPSSLLIDGRSGIFLQHLLFCV